MSLVERNSSIQFSIWNRQELLPTGRRPVTLIHFVIPPSHMPINHAWLIRDLLHADAVRGPTNPT